MGTNAIQRFHGVLFRVKAPDCHNNSCIVSGACVYRCNKSIYTDQALQSNHQLESSRRNGFGAGDGAYLPSGLPDEPGGPDDFIAGKTAWDSGMTHSKDPHDGDFDDRQLPIFR
jgi:hypothetical protein